MCQRVSKMCATERSRPRDFERRPGGMAKRVRQHGANVRRFEQVCVGVSARRPTRIVPLVRRTSVDKRAPRRATTRAAAALRSRAPNAMRSCPPTTLSSSRTRSIVQRSRCRGDDSHHALSSPMRTALERACANWLTLLCTAGSDPKKIAPGQVVPNRCTGLLAPRLDTARACGSGAGQTGTQPQDLSLARASDLLRNGRRPTAAGS
jgi:hypothetical protein